MKALSFCKAIVLLIALSVSAVAMAQAPSYPAKITEFSEIEWSDLIPQDDLDALLNPPEYLASIEDGSPEDQVSSLASNSIAMAEDDRYYEALVSTNIKSEMDGKAIRVPGFIVPLELIDSQVITEFFIVPFFGACIHVPPPPPNQIIHVKYPKGFKFETVYNPFWLSGVLKTTLVENAVATAAYGMEVHSIEDYTLQ